MSRRCEQGSTVLTSNNPFEEWCDTFGDHMLAPTLIDRLVHHCDVVNVRGNSFSLAPALGELGRRLPRDQQRGTNDEETITKRLRAAANGGRPA